MLPADVYIGLRPDRKFCRAKSPAAARRFATRKGSVYRLTHYVHKGGSGLEVLPRVLSISRGI